MGDYGGQPGVTGISVSKGVQLAIGDGCMVFQMRLVLCFDGNGWMDAERGYLYPIGLYDDGSAVNVPGAGSPQFNLAGTPLAGKNGVSQGAMPNAFTRLPAIRNIN